jgi:8-oxo-dGTP diphosphatase
VSVVAALVRRGDEVLVVRNTGVGGAADRWSLPGGSVHAGELLTEAVAREVYEETRLTAGELGSVAVYSEHFIPAYADAMTMVTFEVAAWSGSLRFDSDPDGEVCDCVFVDQRRAAALIEESSAFGPVWMPVVSYLRGDQRHSWFWRIHDDGSGGDTPVGAL